ncbi:hypothetical protein J4436_02715 [Candidatus Woesearchaeota archaeon]|nr:hypothetical protein [Candidatus Woesearchaeota archaeon]
MRDKDILLNELNDLSIYIGNILKEDISLNKTEMNQILNNIEILKIRLDELERKIKKSKPI